MLAGISRQRQFLAVHRTGVWKCAATVVVLWLTCSTMLIAGAPEEYSTTQGDFSALSMQADAARKASELDKAVRLYHRALALRPQWTDGWWSLGTIEYDQNKYADAARAFAKVKALKPKAGTPRVMLGLCEFELGQDANALHDLQDGEKLGILDDQQLWQVMTYHEGVLLRRAAKFEEAQKAFDRLCSRDIEEPQVVQQLGMTALRQPAGGSLAPASTGAEVVSAVGYAECAAAQQKVVEARQSYRELVARYPKYPNIHYAYGRFLISVNDTTGAIDQFKQEIQNQPDHVFARLEIAAVEYSFDSKAALPYAQQAERLNPRLPLTHLYLGLLLLDTGDYLRAIPELEIARKAFPTEPHVYFALGNAYARAGRKEDAARARAKFLSLNQAKQ